MQEPGCGAGVGELKHVVAKQRRERDSRTTERTAIRWTPARAIAGLLGALLFAWTSIHMILVLVFPRTVALH